MFSSTECIVEGVTTFSTSNNSQFGDSRYVQKNGTDMGPQNTCSFADLAIGIIDEWSRRRVLSLLNTGGATVMTSSIFAHIAYLNVMNLQLS